jgi:hypothetical protein
MSILLLRECHDQTHDQTHDQMHDQRMFDVLLISGRANFGPKSSQPIALDALTSLARAVTKLHLCVGQLI